jgi:hypothetical protein
MPLAEVAPVSDRLDGGPDQLSQSIGAAAAELMRRGEMASAEKRVRNGRPVGMPAIALATVSSEPGHLPARLTLIIS